MTFQELDEKYKNLWPAFWKVAEYEKFDEIPNDLKVPDALFLWVSENPDKFKEIPFEFLDHNIRLAAVYKSAESIAYISRSDTDRYDELLYFSIISDPSSLGSIDPTDYSDTLLIKAIKAMSNVSHHLYHVVNRGYKISSDIVSAVFDHGTIGIRALFGYKGLVDLVTDEMIWRGVSKGYVDYNGWYVDLGAVESLGKTHVVQELFASGYWPVTLRLASDKPYFHDVIKPASLNEAIAVYCSEIDGNCPALFKFAVLSYGPDNVVAALHSTSEGLDTLQDLFTEKELAPYAKKYKHIKGRFLEDALGL